MSDDGSTKDDVKVPDNELGAKIKKSFQEEGKDLSMFTPEIRDCTNHLTRNRCHRPLLHG